MFNIKLKMVRSVSQRQGREFKTKKYFIRYGLIHYLALAALASVRWEAVEKSLS